MSRKVAMVIAVSLAAVLAAHFGFFFFRDNFSTHYPAKVLSAEAFRAFEIPWWNFHAGGGQPLAGNPNLLTFYPDNVLYLFLPAHVAFNLHFLIHLAGAWFAMRALSRSRFGATVYLLSGVVISATAFYNLITAVALIPLALLGAERRSPRLIGIAFGLLLLAAEPVTLIGAAISVLIVFFSVAPAAGRPSLLALAMAAALALAIGAPQILAISEIASEVERAVGSSAQTVLRTSLDAKRVAEIFLWPITGFLNDASGLREKLFSTLFLGVIAIPALLRRSRYTVVAASMLFLALGKHNPIVAFAVEQFGWTRVMRFPEKFALPLVIALVVLIAAFYEQTRFKRAWLLVTFVPLLYTTARTLPIDWFAAYRVSPVASPRRVHVDSSIGAGTLPARAEYQFRARHFEPLFGATAGLRYAIQQSPDRMHSTLSRIVVDRWTFASARYLDVATGPDARIVPRASAASGIREAVARFERGEDVAPRAFISAPAQVTAYRRHGQRLEIGVATSGPALLLVNESYFRAWKATLDGKELETLPVDIDRLGIIVPRSGQLVLTFGRHRGLIAATWLLSLVLLVVGVRRPQSPLSTREPQLALLSTKAATAVAALQIEERDGGAGEVERAADED